MATPLQYPFLENPHGQRNLVGYSPQSCKESDTTERQHSTYILVLPLTSQNKMIFLNQNSVFILLLYVCIITYYICMIQTLLTAEFPSTT